MVLMMRGFIKKRLMMEYAYYNLINDVESFFHVWEEDGFICEAVGLYLINEFKKVYVNFLFFYYYYKKKMYA